MAVTSWRMVPKGRWIEQAFSGEGARLFGGRWNSPGTSAVYTSESIALAALEICVHLDREADLGEYVIFPVTFSAHMIFHQKRLPDKWDHDPILPCSMEVGDAWVKKS